MERGGTTPVAGACLCGVVRFEIDAAVGPFELCHCPRCRKSSGSLFLGMVGVRRAALRWLSGADRVRAFDAPLLRAPPPYRRCFCEGCGCTVPDPEGDGDWLEIPVGLLEGDPGVRPDRHILVEHAPAWLKVDPALPALDRRALDRLRRGEVRRREPPEIRLEPLEPRHRAPLVEAARASWREVEPWLPWCQADYGDSEAREWIELAQRARDHGEAYEFAILADGVYAGGCGLNQIDPVHARANLGYWVRSDQTGRGIATEAVRRLALWGFDRTELERVEIVAAVENTASLRVASRAGARFEGLARARIRLHGTSRDAGVYSLVRADRAGLEATGGRGGIP